MAGIRPPALLHPRVLERRRELLDLGLTGPWGDKTGLYAQALVEVVRRSRALAFAAASREMLDRLLHDEPNPLVRDRRARDYTRSYDTLERQRRANLIAALEDVADLTWAPAKRRLVPGKLRRKNDDCA